MFICFSSDLIAAESPNPSCEFIRKRAFCATADCGSWANWCLDDPASHFFYEESFIIGGAVDRIATSASSGFVFPEEFEQSTKDVLSDIDLQFIFKNIR